MTKTLRSNKLIKHIMPEHQNIEYKSSWHDEYLKWITAEYYFGVPAGGVEK